jgi:glyoxylase-like metal-dependent hydrolase (beta-lactamase superfamily II)
VRVTRHGPYLIQLSKLATNCFLVREDDGLTLVDCSVPGSAEAILAAADELGGPIRRIVLTHAHHDHTGSLEPLHHALPDAELLVGAREVRLLTGDFGTLPGEPAGSLHEFVYPSRTVVPDRLLEPGDRVGSLEAVDARGHTPGQLGFLDSRDGTLIAGDAYITVGTPFVTSELVLRFPFPALMGTWHAPTAVDSARRLLGLEPSRLATGHGRVVEAPLDAMEQALARVGCGALSGAGQPARAPGSASRRPPD